MKQLKVLQFLVMVNVIVYSSCNSSDVVNKPTDIKSQKAMDTTQKVMDESVPEKINTLPKEIEKPVLVTTGEQGSSELDAEQIWKYKNYLFICETAMIARPITYYSIQKINNGRKRELKNAKLFGANAKEVERKVNDGLKADFARAQAEDPKCFKDYRALKIDEMDISVDADHMIFSYCWDEGFLNDGSYECIYPTSTFKIKIEEIEPLIAE